MLHETETNANRSITINNKTKESAAYSFSAKKKNRMVQTHVSIGAYCLCMRQPVHLPIKQFSFIPKA
uniref:Uncharacterized protein n=1 Tax=Rhizophora mucronata TaxID=61149 RepID=A0A2P2L166_RHIMU